MSDLLDHLQRSSDLGRGQARRVVEEVLAWHDEDVEAFVRRRHRELRAEGLANPAVFARVAQELRGRRVRPPELSERQIRRLIYG